MAILINLCCNSPLQLSPIKVGKPLKALLKGIIKEQAAGKILAACRSLPTMD
jgi:hypothetical protein